MGETVTVSRELLQQALEALDTLDASPSGVIDHYELERRKQALRAALAQQVADHTELDLADAYNRRLRRQLEQEWCDVQSIKAAQQEQALKGKNHA